MAVNFDDIVTQASALSLQDRARLAHQLLRSLDEVDDDDPAEVERLWMIEIARRVDAFECGEMETLDGEGVMAQARARLKR